MTSFATRQIVIAQTAGERLKKVRLGSNLSLDGIAKQIGIRKAYLESIECGQYSDLPGEVYAVEFIKSYSRFLRLSSEEVVAMYQQERAQGAHAIRKKGNDYGRRLWAGLSSYAGTFLIGRFALVVLVLGMATGSAWAVSWYTRPPQLEIFSPRTYHVVNGRTIVVSGRVQPGTRVFLNDYPMPVDEGGVFREEMSIPEGSSLFKVSAIDKKGRKSEQFRAVAASGGYVAGVHVTRTIE